MLRLSGQDAYFLYQETQTTPMHTLKILVGRPTGARAPGFAETRQAIAASLDAIPGFRRRIVWVPRIHDVIDYHSSGEDAARTATNAGVGTLVLTHPVPPPPAGTEHEWVELARRHFDGEVLLAHDLLTVTA